MNATEIRQSFLDFFAAKGHAIVPSASLLPTAPNLLFTNAGMNPFVPYFLGEREARDTRVADTQKCIRAGGKHNDLDDVGYDAYHHTFFEMLGNWSFGDYFKEEAITWAWELLTEVWGFPPERLYATVYAPGEGDPAEFDQEAYDFWKAIFEKAGLDPTEHILNGNKKDNFWMMGETGPCGPCSELHIDLTEKGDTKGNLVNQDDPRCIEIWNLVFIQFNAQENGSFLPLKNRHIDTGMGFERVAGILATTKNFTDYSRPPSNYESDLFGDLFDVLTDLSGHEYQGTLPERKDAVGDVEMKDIAFRVLADHARTLSCSIADGILPGNEGRNYVLRRILRRAVMYAQRLGLPNGSFRKLVPAVVSKLGDTFPELKSQATMVEKVVASEEDSFSRTIDRGMQMLDRITADQSGKISGEDAFTLYDTYGFPLDLTEIIARERNIEVDTAGFEKRMNEQRVRARAAQKKETITVTEDKGAGGQIFVGYDPENLIEFTTTVTDVVLAGGKNYLVFAETPFYAEMGGQVGDAGTAEMDSGHLEILTTSKDGAGRHLHEVRQASKELIGQAVKVTVGESRKEIQRHHSGTHVLHYALRQVLGTHVHQAGSYVGPDRLRFDYTHYEAPSPEQLIEIEKIVNARILENGEVVSFEVPFDEKPEDVIAFFGEKYGDRVRVVDIGGFSKELCGGTHVRTAGEIGLLKIVSDAAIAAGTRRIEAVTGQAAYELFVHEHQMVTELARSMNVKPDEVTERVEKLEAERKQLEKELRAFRQRDAAGQADQLVANAVDREGIRLVAATVDVDSPNDLRGMGVDLQKKLGPSVIVLGTAMGEKSSIAALCSPEAIEAGYQAGAIIRDLAGQLGGKGGGKPDFAMGGGKDPERLAEVLKTFREQEPTPSGRSS